MAISDDGYEVEDAEQMATLEVYDQYAGLRSLLNELTGERVVLHTVAGIQVEGKLTSGQGHEDGIATIMWTGTPYHVPVHMIVVVEEVPER